MNLLPKITIITPSYNQGRYIEQTILSVLDQGYPNLEYIIIDGGSTDETVGIIKKYQGQVTYWVSEPDSGQTEAINKGFQLATGDIVNWINSDDYYASETFQNIARSFTNPATKAITTTVHNFEEGGAEWDELTSRQESGVAYVARSFNNQPGTFFRKEVWDNYFPLPQQLRYTMDQYLWFCFWIEHGNNAFLIEDYTTVYFRRHALSKTSSSLTDTVFNHLGKVFFNEHNLIFWSFFDANKKSYAEILSAYFWNGFDYENKKIIFPHSLSATSSTVDNLFQVYLFQLIKEDFRLGFFERLKQNLNHLQPQFFSANEKKEIKKLWLSALNPTAFKAYRQLYWKLKQAITKA